MERTRPKCAKIGENVGAEREWKGPPRNFPAVRGRPNFSLPSASLPSRGRTGDMPRRDPVGSRRRDIHTAGLGWAAGSQKSSREGRRSSPVSASPECTDPGHHHARATHRGAGQGLFSRWFWFPYARFPQLPPPPQHPVCQQLC